MRFIKGSCEYAMAKPCVLCMQHIQDAGIKKIRYTNYDGLWEEIRL